MPDNRPLYKHYALLTVPHRLIKKLLFSLFFLAIVNSIMPQRALPEQKALTPGLMDTLRQQLRRATTDTARINMLIGLARGSLQLGLPDSQLLYAEKALVLAKKTSNAKAESVANFLIIWAHRHTGRYPEALKTAFNNLQIAEQSKDSSLILEALRHVMFTYADMKEYHPVIEQARRAQRLVHSGYFKNEKELKRSAFTGYMNFISGAFEELKQFDSALHYRKLAYQTALFLHNDREPAGSFQRMAVSSGGLAGLFFKMATYDSAFSYYNTCIRSVKKAGFRFDLEADAQLGLSKIYQLRNHRDSAIFYAKLSLNTSNRMKRLAEQQEAASLLHRLYAGSATIDSAYKYLLLATTLKDSLFNIENIKQVESIKYKQALSLQQAEQEKKEAQLRYTSRIRTFAIIGGLILLLSFVFFIYRVHQLKHENRIKVGFTKRIQQIEMRALRAQMNPHFIFNCLNSINRYIVKSDHKTASNYLTKFARLIRLILDNTASENITLDKEIQTLQLYVDMEVLRFDNVFDYSIEIDEGVMSESINIPSMLLQPYVENAIWHGLLHKETGGGKLWIRFRQPTENLLIAEIEDNGIGREKARELKSKEVIKKKSYGMQISKDRIFLINELYNTNANVRVEDLTDDEGSARGTKVTVEIPAKIL